MIMINEEQVSFKGNEIELQAEFTLLCRKIKEILKATHGEERAEEMFSLMIETSAKTDEEIEEEIKKIDKQLEASPFLNVIAVAFTESFKRGFEKNDD